MRVAVLLLDPLVYPDSGAVHRPANTTEAPPSDEANPSMVRDYAAIAAALAQPDREQRARRAIDRLWERLSPLGVSWIGVYTASEHDAQMVLAYCRDKPACSPIGLHGACGRAFQSGAALVVHDVARLGANYIACDPRDRSELVLPLFEPDGRCWGVLDADSFDVSAFSPADVAGMQQVMCAAGLTCGAARAIVEI